MFVIDDVEPEPSFRIFPVNNDIIGLSFIGPQSPATITASLQHVQPEIERLQRQGKPVNFLIDYGQMGSTSIEANKRAMQAMNELPFHKMAGINASPFIRFITNTIASVTRYSNRARHFTDRDEAERWLREP